MPTSPAIPQVVWLDLADAARYLGVHFTSLRRWADAGDLAHIRTPGGRRRFALADLQAFVESQRRGRPSRAMLPPCGTLDLARRHIQHNVQELGWLARLQEEQRSRFRQSGQRLLGLLLQYSARLDNGDAFLAEGRRLAADYGRVCRQAGLSVVETARVFLFFRRSILNSIHETSGLTSSSDGEGARLYRRMADFLDVILLATLDGCSEEQAPAYLE